MRKSRWLLGDDYYIRKRSRRIVVEVGGRRDEFSLAAVDLLAVKGGGHVSSDALELFCREKAHLVIHHGRHYWLDCGPERGVEYLIGQHAASQRLAAAMVRTYLLSAAALFQRVGSEDAELFLYYAENPLRAVSAGALEKTETMILTEIFEHAQPGLDYSRLEEAYSLYKVFLEAEAISAAMRAGLNPALGPVPLYRALALEFHPPLIWETLLSLKAPRKESPQALLVPFKEKLEGTMLFSGRRVAARKALHVRARALASAAVNDKVRISPIEWYL